MTRGGSNRIIDEYTDKPLSRGMKYYFRHKEKYKEYKNGKGKEMQKQSVNKYREKNKEWFNEYQKQWRIKKSLRKEEHEG